MMITIQLFETTRCARRKINSCTYIQHCQCSRRTSAKHDRKLQMTSPVSCVAIICISPPPGRGGEDGVTAPKGAQKESHKFIHKYREEVDISPQEPLKRSHNR